MQYKVALFIGRFQPFHNGHLYSLKKCLEIADKVVIGIGSSNVCDKFNPWDFETRKRMVEMVLREPSLPAQAGLRGDSSQVVAIPDLHNDQKWGTQILDLVQGLGYEPGQVVGVGNNDWTNRILRQIGIEVYESGLYNRNELEGIKIRELMRQGDSSWKERVPEVVVQYLDEHNNAGKS